MLWLMRVWTCMLAHSSHTLNPPRTNNTHPRSFPVLHGGDYISLGFSIGKEGEFVYISDVKAIPPDTWAYLKGLSRIKTLVLDSLKWGTFFLFLM